jgi:hypothetical protein
MAATADVDKGITLENPSRQMLTDPQFPPTDDSEGCAEFLAVLTSG